MDQLVRNYIFPILNTQDSLSPPPPPSHSGLVLFHPYLFRQINFDPPHSAFVKIITLFNFYITKGQAYMCFCLVLVLIEYLFFNIFYKKIHERKNRVWFLYQRNGCPGLHCIKIIILYNSFSVGGQTYTCLW